MGTDHPLAHRFVHDLRRQYLKHLGDGCLALFADPDQALEFVRTARTTLSAADIAVRSVINLGRVTFAHDEPIGRAIGETARLLQQAPSDRILLTRSASAFLDGVDTITHDT